ncbi:MAG: YHS domain-containing protein [Planctomycetota bacterium]
MRATLLITVLLAASLALVGCGNDEPDTTPIPEPQAATTGAGTDADATLVNCVICGDHQFALQDETARSDYEGETFYFCHTYCKNAFDKEPAKYASTDAG